MTIVALSRLVHEALAAAERARGRGRDRGRGDRPAHARPARPRGDRRVGRAHHRLVVAHEAVEHGGFGAEIAAQVQEAAFDHLDAPIERVGAPFAPVPLSAPLEDAYLPGADEIVAAVRGLR